jgi:hypothetical protein
MDTKRSPLSWVSSPSIPLRTASGSYESGTAFASPIQLHRGRAVTRHVPETAPPPARLDALDVWSSRSEPAARRRSLDCQLPHLD